MSNHNEKVHNLVIQAAIYVPFDGEGCRIISYIEEEHYFLAEGEESGEQYQIHYADVDLKQDMFYKLTLMENA